MRNLENQDLKQSKMKTPFKRWEEEEEVEEEEEEEEEVVEAWVLQFSDN